MTIAMGKNNSTDSNCISIDCLKEKLKRMCTEGSAPSYLDCENVLRCIDDNEQEIMKCAKRYLVYDSRLSGRPHDLLLRSWCDYVTEAVENNHDQI